MKKLLLLLLFTTLLFSDCYPERPDKSQITQSMTNLDIRARRIKYDTQKNTINYAWLFDIKTYHINTFTYIGDNNMIHEKEKKDYEKNIKQYISNNISFLNSKSYTYNNEDKTGLVHINVTVQLNLYNEATKFYYGLLTFEIVPATGEYTKLIAPKNYFEYISVAGFKNNIFSNIKKDMELLIREFRTDYLYVYDNFSKEIELTDYEFKNILTDEQKISIRKLINDNKAVLKIKQ